MSDEIARLERQLKFNKRTTLRSRHGARVNYYDSDIQFVLRKLKTIRMETIQKCKIIIRNGGTLDQLEAMKEEAL